MSKRARTAAVAAALAAAGAAALALGRARTPPIRGADGRPAAGSVASLERVRLGGVEQTILVRGRDRTRPVLLFLHGGPGMPGMFLAHAWQRPLEDDFVVVHWDRRGAGKSREGIPTASLTVRRVLDDLHELARLLRARFGQRRILLVGHSWGSYLGLLAVRERPDDYIAFVGTGQMAGTAEEVRRARREALLVRAAASDDAALLARLADARAAPTEDDVFRYGGELANATSIWPIVAAGLRAPEYHLGDVLALKRATDRVNREMQHDVEPRPLEGEIDRVEVPVFFVLGRWDLNAPSELAAAYLARLDAPVRRLEWLERSAHFPFFEEPERFRDALLRAHAAARAWNDAGRQLRTGGAR
ncbi:MAG TPA: alpha/beta hydrolase [Anaeromyxobacter sp.]|nr:alpha/beta hydrolase [Anaeromyxobacter sp.]